MKKLVLLFIVCISPFFLTPAQAQTEKGNLMIGAQVANIGGTFQNKSNAFDFGLSPSAAYFVRNNFAIGGLLSIGLHTQKNAPNTFTYGLGPWARYYFPIPDNIKLSPHAAFFVDGFAGFSGESHSDSGGSTNGIKIAVGPGMSYFITSNVSLDAILNYNLTLGFGNATTINHIGLNIGFQIFLPAHDLKEKYQHGQF